MKPSVKEPVILSVAKNPVKSILLAALVLMCGIFVSCGSEQGDSGQGIADSGDQTVNEIPASAGTTSDFSGKVVIKFKDGTSVRLSSFDGLRTNDERRATSDADGPFITTKRDSPREAYEIRRVNEVVRSSTLQGAPDESNSRGLKSATPSRVTNIRRVMTASEEEIDQWREWWRKQGEILNDWNLYYYAYVPRYEDAKELVNELNEKGVIDYAEILTTPRLFSSETPDFSSQQYYLDSANTGGLGVKDAWEKLDILFPGVHLRGQNSMVVDEECDWNFDHEMLPIDETGEYLLEPGMLDWQTYGPKQCKDIPFGIEHGTAIVGIISAQGNGSGHGIQGIVPETAMRVASLGGGGVWGSTTAEGDLPAGSILTIPMGITSITGKDLPLEAKKFYHEVFTDSVKTGNIIIEAAGNGNVNLDDNEQIKPAEGTPSGFNDPDKDSGAIIVGSSLGANMQKKADSNCGSRVDLFAWGGGIVSTGLGDLYYAPGTDPVDPDNPTKYTSQATGTSAASAQIAGIAALVQSYVRQLVAEAGYEPKVVYLDSKQMRTILKNSGQPAVYGQTPNDPNPNCNIGVQPDAVKALDVAKEFINNNVLKIVPFNKHVSGISYDMDGDKRAELISFSRDGKWYIDLSSVQPPASSIDGYGTWDLILDASNSLILSSSKDAMLFPVVHDYNSDGRGDLALYDSINGKWYIKYTTAAVIASPQGEAISWDRVIDYSADPAWKAYSRPVPGDYNGDYWLDPALQTPDGHWLIDYGGFDGIVIASEGEAISGIQFLDKLGSIEKDVKYLTDEQLAQAPGWAWLPVASQASWGLLGASSIVAKSPDSIIDENNLIQGTPPDFDDIADSVYFPPHVYGDNSSIFNTGKFNSYSISSDLVNKTINGEWLIFSGVDSGWGLDNPVPITLNPDGIFGDVLCRPIAADYDGDKTDDRAVQCGTNWKLVYSSTNQVREVELDQAIDPVPAYVYAGGIKYQDTVDLYNYYKSELGGTKSSTIFDAPPPIGPYFAQCVKYWAPNASYCWDK